MFYAGASAGGQPPPTPASSSSQHEVQDPHHHHNQQPSSSDYSDGQLDQSQQHHFVVISSNDHGENGDRHHHSSDGSEGAPSPPSGSCNCTANNGYICESRNCINKFQQHSQIHLQHQSSVDEQIVSYNMAPHPRNSHQQHHHNPHHLNDEEDEELDNVDGGDEDIPQHSHNELDDDGDGMIAEGSVGDDGRGGGMNFHESIEQVANATGGGRPMVTPKEELHSQQDHNMGGAMMQNAPVDEKELRRQRLAEMARLRYQNLSKEEKKAVNSRRMLLRKRKRQREREMEELEAILRATNDIEEDVVFIGELREKRQRESRARAARSRYHSMTPEERRAYNQKRRMRQLGLAANATANGEASAAVGIDTELIKQQIAQQNARKAELARQRYHRMSIEERKLYNKRRTESLRRRRMEEEALLATPAGQIDSEALLKAQQIMIRNALRAEKARERYKRKAPEERERKRARQAIQKAIKQEQADPNVPGGDSLAGTSGDILSAIEREVMRRTAEARHVLEQKSRLMGDPNAHLLPQIKQEAVIIQHSLPPHISSQHLHHQQEMSHQHQLVNHSGQLSHQQHQQILHHQQHQSHQQIQEVMVLPGSGLTTATLVQQQNHHPHLSQHHHHQQHGGGSIISASPFSAQTIVHAAAPTAISATGGIVMQQGDGSGKPTTKYVSYMQLPAGATQSGFILADGQFVAIQEPIQGYAIEQPGFDNNFQHINPGTAVLRTTGGAVGSQNAQPIIIGQRVELVNAPGDPHHHQSPTTYHTHQQSQQQQLQSPNTIHVVNYSGIQQQHQQHTSSHQQQIQQHQIQQIQPQHHIITQHVQQQQPQQQQYTIQQQQIPQTPQQQSMSLLTGGTQQIHVIPVTSAAASTSSSAASGADVPQQHQQMDDKVMSQRAKRAERARRRYHEMSAEARHEFNAKRAHALKMSRLKDEELCRMGDELEMTQAEITEDMRQSIEAARIRRAKRAETARQKYQKMSPEQRKIHNAMRDAQRRQRKREMEESCGMGIGGEEKAAS